MPGPSLPPTKGGARSLSFTVKAPGTGPQASDRAEVEDKEEIRAVDYLKVCLPKGQTCSNQVCTFC